MALIETFEEMKSWQKARELNKIIYFQTIQPEFQKDYALKDQIRKSSISIMSNIAEGFERNNLREFRYFMRVAKGSTGEIRSQLYTALDLGYLNQSLFNNCIALTSEISNLIGGFIESLNIKISKIENKTQNKSTNTSAK